jgi:hypothetical protein
LQRLWNDLLSSGTADIADCRPAAQRWHDAALKLMAIADEACRGVGFVDCYPFANYVFSESLARLNGRRTVMPHLPHSVCRWVPRGELCVQPKATTPDVGCTLRSLSHHLALLPGVGEVRTTWHFAGKADDDQSRALNLLLVPLPYRIDGGSFAPEPDPSGGTAAIGAGFFSVRQSWLAAPKAKRVADFLKNLIQQAANEVGAVHGVVLPEGALSAPYARTIARTLASQTDVELFIAGVSVEGKGKKTTLPRNSVYASIFLKHRVYADWLQSKHHRWRLDKHQIRRYQLGHALNPVHLWWEKIDVSNRECVFYVFRPGASLTTLVCEDLARIDPVQGVIRAIGPTLVVALLMDGPQMEKRWPGRYATVLADDPGSAVLTLTCLGLVRRSFPPGSNEGHKIALWKDPHGSAEELVLPRGTHALLLTLSPADETGRTLDGRSDEGSTVRLSLSGVRAISAANPSKWFDCGVEGW